MSKKETSASDELPGIPTAEQKADYKERMRDIEAARESPIFAPYFPLVETNVLRNSVHIEPAGPKNLRKRPAASPER